MNALDQLGHHWVSSQGDLCIAQARESLRSLVSVRHRRNSSVILAGPRSVGKTTIALWMLRQRHCLSQNNAVCPEAALCTSCRLLKTASHPDVMVVGEDSAGQSLGIEEARTLIDFFSLSPWSGNGRSALVLGSERFTREASNALLKTLEEPPPGALLLFTSSAVERIPATVRSRVPTVSLSPVDDATLAQWATARGIDHNTQTRIAARGLPGRVVEGIPQRVQEQIDWVMSSLHESVQPTPLFDILKQGIHTNTHQEALNVLHEWIEAFQGVLRVADTHTSPTSTVALTQGIRLLERARTLSLNNVSIDPLLYDLAASLEGIFSQYHHAPSR